MFFKSLPNTVSVCMFLLSFNVNAYSVSISDSGDSYERTHSLSSNVQGNADTYFAVSGSVSAADYAEYEASKDPLISNYDGYIQSNQPSHEFVYNFATASNSSTHVSSVTESQESDGSIKETYDGSSFSTISTHAESEYIYRVGFGDGLELGTIISLTIDYTLGAGIYCQDMGSCWGTSISQVAALGYDPVGDTANMLGSGFLDVSYTPNVFIPTASITKEKTSTFTFDFTYGLGEELWIKLFAQSDFSVQSLCNDNTRIDIDGNTTNEVNGCGNSYTGIAWAFADPLITAMVNGTDINVSKQLADTALFANESISVSAVPVPAAVWLFGSGLIGLIGVARRKKS